ncbi:hypothetical protein NF430_10845, partial [Streptococcus suis]|uniref:hypothetical protein n=1 Tax=Streptococcus suis TaxID=1307 RepID=UPI002118FBA2
WDFFLYSKKLHNFHGGFTHYRYYRAIFSLAYLGKGVKVDMWYNGKISIREKLLKKCRRNDVTYY